MNITYNPGVAGSYSIVSFFDHDIDEDINTFFVESGAITGMADPGHFWQISEPGFVFGNIYENMLAGTPDNTNSTPLGLEEDVSMSVGWHFSLSANQTANISLVLSETAPVSGFYLSQTDPDTQSTIYYSYSFIITGENGCAGDTTPPVAQCKNITIQLDAAGNAEIDPADIDNGSSDNCGIASMMVAPNAFSCAHVGTNTVTLTVTDVNRNQSTCTATVMVEDRILPVAQC